MASNSQQSQNTELLTKPTNNKESSSKKLRKYSKEKEEDKE